MTSPAGELRYADRYRVLRRLGSGGMATVFLAEDERLGRQVAVKRLHADSPEDMAQRFGREARLGASMNHPNLVTVYDTITDPEGVVIVMEYVDGPSLAHVLKDGPPHRDRALATLREIGSALDNAHGHGIVHRDVKPANILLAEGGEAKLADLGIAFAAEHATQITRTGTVLGTPSYMAPEQLEGREVGRAADVYALATVAFEALSGRKARTGGSPLEIAHRIATESAPDVREAWAEAPAGVSEVLCQGMSLDPANRPQSAGELVERLEAELPGGRGTAATRRAEPSEGSPAGGKAAGAAAAGLGAGAAAAGAAAADAGRADPGEAAPVADGAPPGEEAPPAEGAPSGEEARPADGADADADARPAERPAADHGPSAEATGAPVAPGLGAEAERPPATAGGREQGAVPSERPPASPDREAASSYGGRRAWLAPVSLLLVIVAATVAAILALGGGGTTDGGQSPPEGSPSESGKAPGATGGGGAAGSTALDPVQTVTSFYERSAAGNYQGAWALADADFRSQLGGFESFRQSQSTLESIEFAQAEPVSQSADAAQVAIRSVATHSDGVDRCQGTLSLSKGGVSGWLIDRAGITCPQSTRGGGAASAPQADESPSQGSGGADVSSTAGSDGSSSGSGSSDSATAAGSAKEKGQQVTGKAGKAAGGNK